MFTKDPIQHVEKITQEVHDSVGKYTQPVIRRYPLLFAFLIVFSVAAILHGFELFVDRFALFREKPFVLIGVGIALLFFTGTLYKFLRKNS